MRIYAHLGPLSIPVGRSSAQVRRDRAARAQRDAVRTAQIKSDLAAIKAQVDEWRGPKVVSGFTKRQSAKHDAQIARHAN